MVKFDVSMEESVIIGEIAETAHQIAVDIGSEYSVKDASMDITACHCNGNKLRLKELMRANYFNFVHDVFGIRDNIDRTTGKLPIKFSPRFSE